MKLKFFCSIQTLLKFLKKAVRKMFTSYVSVYNMQPTFYSSNLWGKSGRLYTVKDGTKIQGNIIDHVNATQFLGIIIDNKLNWSGHINNIKKISKSLGIIYKIQSFLNRITLRSLYHTFVFYQSYTFHIRFDSRFLTHSIFEA